MCNILSYPVMTLYMYFCVGILWIPRFVLYSDSCCTFMLSVYTWGHFQTYVYTSQ